MTKVDVVAGARPNFIKAGPIMCQLESDPEFTGRFVYTGQHVDPVMCTDIFKSVGLSAPKVFDVDASPGLHFTGMCMYEYSKVLTRSRPDLVIVVGDTNTSLAGAIAAKREKLPLVHVEAGFRHSNINEPEEQNRRMIDSISDLLLPATLGAESNLIAEKCVGDVRFIGNIMIDALEMIRSSSQWEATEVEEYDVIITLHRPENVDDQSTLLKIYEGLLNLSQDYNIWFPVHPRTQDKLGKLGKKRAEWMGDPMPYLEFMKTVSKAKVIITDSGGLQGESSYLGVPVLLLRNHTGWQDWVEAGRIQFIGEGMIRMAVERAMLLPRDYIYVPGFDGQAATRLMAALRDFIKR